MLGMYFSTVRTITGQRWINAQDGNLKALRKLSWIGSKVKDVKAWESAFNDYIKEFGLNKDFEKLLDLQKKCAKVQIEFLKDMKGKRYLLNEIQLLTEQIRSLEKEDEEVTKLIDVISTLRVQGISIDIKKDTVYEIEGIIRNYGKGNQ
jgi:hypothetical protein